VYKLNPVDPQLETAWFQPLKPGIRYPGFDILVSSLCFQMQLVPLQYGRRVRVRSPEEISGKAAAAAASSSSSSSASAIDLATTNKSVSKYDLDGWNYAPTRAEQARWQREWEKVGLALFTSRYVAVKTHSIDDSQYVPCSQSDTPRE
jgi:hypothetical protein